MELPYTTPSQVAQAYCVPWLSSDPLEPLYDQAAANFDTDQDQSLGAIIKVALQNQMMLYRKAQCTDCATEGLPPTQTVINPPVKNQIAPPQGIVQTNYTDAEISAGIGDVQGGLGALASSGLIAAGAIPIIGDVVNVVADIAGIFTQAHAQAVAREQATNCAVALAFNKYIPQYDLAVASGQMAASDALAAVQQVINSQLLPALQPVISGHNWGWGASQVLQAHLWFRQQWYPTLENSSLTNSGSRVSSLVATVTASPMYLVAAAIVAVLIFSGKRSAT